MHETPGTRPPAKAASADVTAQPLAAAFQAFDSANWAAAAAALDRAQQEGVPLSGEAWDCLGASLFKLGSLREATRAYEQAFATFSRDTSEEAVRNALRSALRLVALHIALGEPSAVQGWEQRALRVCGKLGGCIERGYLAVA